MFVQVVQGAVADPTAMKSMGDRWHEEVSPGAVGWLGATAGVTADGNFVLFARFESAEAARQNSDRSEQGQWWAEAQKCFTGEITFADFTDVVVVRGGESQQAGFVQVMLGTSANVGRERELTQQFDALTEDFRPEILGGVVAVRDDGAFAQAFYFTSEVEARAGEQKEMPEQFRQAFEEEQALTSNLRFLDLTEPWFYSPR